MSVPRPAMFVAMVTAPRRPLCATISDSRSTFSGLAFSSSKGMPSSFSREATISDFSTDVVPTCRQKAQSRGEGAAGGR